MRRISRVFVPFREWEFQSRTRRREAAKRQLSYRPASPSWLLGELLRDVHHAVFAANDAHAGAIVVRVEDVAPVVGT